MVESSEARHSAREATGTESTGVVGGGTAQPIAPGQAPDTFPSQIRGTITSVGTSVQEGSPAPLLPACLPRNEVI